MANAPSRGEGLVEQLRRQWTFAEPPAELIGPGLRILDFVDDDGLLDAPLETILEQSPDEARRGGWTGSRANIRCWARRWPPWTAR